MMQNFMNMIMMMFMGKFMLNDIPHMLEGGGPIGPGTMLAVTPIGADMLEYLSQLHRGEPTTYPPHIHAQMFGMARMAGIIETKGGRDAPNEDGILAIAILAELINALESGVHELTVIEIQRPHPDTRIGDYIRVADKLLAMNAVRVETETFTGKGEEWLRRQIE